jgi:hypothetical protein
LRSYQIAPSAVSSRTSRTSCFPTQEHYGYAPAVEVAAEQSVLLELDPPAARITLNRPEKRNALSLELRS